MNEKKIVHATQGMTASDIENLAWNNGEGTEIIIKVTPEQAALFDLETPVGLNKSLI